MLDLPESAKFDKTLPKKLFYEKLGANAALKRLFVDQIAEITWLYKIAPKTANVAEGDALQELEVIKIKLTGEQLDDAIVPKMDKAIPYPILFLIEGQGFWQAQIAYKDIKRGRSENFAKVEILQYYKTKRSKFEDLPCSFEGLDVDAVYENFVRQIAGEALNDAKPGRLRKPSSTKKKRRNYNARSTRSTRKSQKKNNSIDKSNCALSAANWKRN